MRHKIAGFKLGRNSGHRSSLRKNLIKQLFEHGRIETTEAKAKAIRGQAERFITLAKRSSKKEAAQIVHARRLAVARLGDAQTVKKLFDDIAPRFDNRQGGYTRLLKLGPRMGDAAKMVVIELVEE